LYFYYGHRIAVADRNLQLLASQFFYLNFLVKNIITSYENVYHFDCSITDRSQLPMIAFSWWDDKGTFRAGETATIKVKVLENGDKIDKNNFHLILNVNGKEGNSSYVSTVLTNFEGDFDHWKISFTPIKVGLFNVLISEDRYKVFDSSLHFQVEPGIIKTLT